MITLLLGHKWTESEALVRTVGPRLKRIYLALRGGAWDNPMQPAPLQVPRLDQLFQLCPQLEDLTASYGPLTVSIKACV